MKWINKGSKGIEIIFEETDSIEELRVVEQGIAFIRNLLSLISIRNKQNRGI